MPLPYERVVGLGLTIAQKLRALGGAGEGAEAATAHLDKLVFAPLAAGAAPLSAGDAAAAAALGPRDVVLCVARDMGSGMAYHVEPKPERAIPPAEKKARLWRGSARRLAAPTLCVAAAAAWVYRGLGSPCSRSLSGFSPPPDRGAPLACCPSA